MSFTSTETVRPTSETAQRRFSLDLAPASRHDQITPMNAGMRVMAMHGRRNRKVFHHVWP